MKKILVINNDIDTMSLLKSWLEKKAYQVKYTSSKDEVPKIIKEFAPELVIADVLQKDAVLELKNHKKNRSIPVILMTGYTLRQSAPALAVDDTIEKPFNLPLLERKIERLLERTG